MELFVFIFMDRFYFDHSCYRSIEIHIVVQNIRKLLQKRFHDMLYLQMLPGHLMLIPA